MAISRVHWAQAECRGVCCSITCRVSSDLDLDFNLDLGFRFGFGIRYFGSDLDLKTFQAAISRVH